MWYNKTSYKSCLQFYGSKKIKTQDLDIIIHFDKHEFHIRVIPINTVLTLNYSDSSTKFLYLISQEVID